MAKATELEMEDLQAKLTELETELAELEVMQDEFQIDDSDFEDSYCDMLDECYPEVFGISPSRILRECDPIAYSCGLSDYVDGLDLQFETSHPEEFARMEEIKEEIAELEASL